MSCTSSQSLTHLQHCVMYYLFLAPRPCEAAKCANILHSTCLMYSGKPQCKCIQSCTFELSEVCGSDGVTYQNECELKRAACLNKNQLEIAKRGPCPRTKCIPHCHKRSRPVCGSDGVTYENECLLKKSACEKNKEIRIVNNGSCQGMYVSLFYDGTASYGN